MDSAFICKANDQAQGLAFVRKILYHPAGWHGPLDIDGWESHEWIGGREEMEWKLNSNFN